MKYLRIFRILMASTFVVVLGGSLSGCDSNTIQAGNTLSQDGNAAALAYVAYMNNTIEAIKANCDSENFQNFVNSYIANRDVTASLQKSAIATIYASAGKCYDTSPNSATARFRAMAQDGQQVANVYASLSRLTDGKNQINVQTKFDSTVSDIQTASKQTINASLKTGMDEAVSALVGHYDAKGVVNFANDMQKVPTELAKSLTDNAEKLDEIYKLYDDDMNKAISLAYQAQVADTTPVLQQYFEKLNLKITSADSENPFLAGFAASLHQMPIASNSKQARLKLINLLKNVSTESAGIVNAKTKPMSLANLVSDVNLSIKIISEILHPQTISPQPVK